MNRYDIRWTRLLKSEKSGLPGGPRFTYAHVDGLLFAELSRLDSKSHHWKLVLAQGYIDYFEFADAKHARAYALAHIDLTQPLDESAIGSRGLWPPRPSGSEGGPGDTELGRPERDDRVPD